MLTFIARRALWTVLVMFVITVLVFVIFFKIPGVDPARAIAGRNPSPQIMAEVREQFGMKIITEAIDNESLDLVEEYADVISE